MQTKPVIIGSIRLPTSQHNHVFRTCSRVINLEHRLIELLFVLVTDVRVREISFAPISSASFGQKARLEFWELV